MRSLGKLISIEGNIGSGKSTLLKILTRRFPDIQCVDEPVRDWMDLDLLSLYYQDQKRWAFTFQAYCLFSRIRAINHQTIDSGLMISERSIEADREVFAKLLKKKGFINQTEWKLYQSLYTGFQEELNPKPVDLFFYLRTKPEICFDRIAKRSRSGESTIPLEYLRDLDQRHENWLGENPKAIVLDGNQQFEHSAQVLESLVNQIRGSLSDRLSYSL